jgi:hypothetical protein
MTKIALRKHSMALVLNTVCVFTSAQLLSCRTARDILIVDSVFNGWVGLNFNDDLPYPGLGKYTLDQVELVRPTGGESKNSLTKRRRVLQPKMLV